MIIVGNKYEIINSYAGNDGKIVTVTGFAAKEDFHLDGMDPYCYVGDRWFIDVTMKTNRGTYINHMGEKQLKPIYDGNEEISWEDMKDIWQPSSITDSKPVIKVKEKLV